MKQKRYISKFLFRNNLFFTFVIIVCNWLAFTIADSNKNTLVSLNIFFSCLIFFLYRFKISALVNSHWLSIKKELMYINYPFTIGAFFILIFSIFGFDVYQLSTINKEALNTTFIFTYFMSTISVLMPSILLLVYMYLLSPAIILPSLEERKRKKILDILVFALFLMFILFSTFQIVGNAIEKLNLSKMEKFKAAKLPVQYSTQFLKYTDLSEPVREKLSRQKVEVPFLYTTKGYKFNTYEAAQQFCASMNAKVANHLEIYNIIFHRFDTFGEKYYWTSDKAGRNNLVLHFKNMSYEIMKKPKDISAVVYCTSSVSKDYKMFEQKYFFKNKPVQIGDDKLKIDAKKNFDIDKMQTGTDKQGFKRQQTPPQTEDDTSAKHVNFNVKHVPLEYFNELLDEGYYYETKVKINNYYASSEQQLRSKINEKRDRKNIKLCYYPFTEYTNMTINDEIQIWRQSFCSPSFELVNQTPEIKSANAKDAYCYANGGRVASIPETMGIIKTLNINADGSKFWTNAKTNVQAPVAINVIDGQSIEVDNSSQNAYTFCVKKSANPSNIIANFKSRFRGVEGSSYARNICPNCKYYEVPDTVLIQY